MRKFISVLITVAMLMSFAATFRTAEPVSAATYQLTKAPSYMGTNIVSSGRYVSYLVVNYTMGENIVSTGDGAAYAGKQALLVSGVDNPDDMGFYVVVQTTNCDSLGHFSLATSNVKYDGLYKVIISNAGGYVVGNHYANPSGGGDVLWGAYVFIKYVWQMDKPASITFNCLSTTWSGYLRFGSGKGADTGKGTVYVNYPDFTSANSSSVQIDGNWAMSVVINQKGLYLVWVEDNYAGDFSGTTDTFTAKNSVTGAYDSLIAGLDNLAYDSRTTGGVKITVDSIVKPTILYNIGTPQQLVLKVTDDLGDPVTGVIWTVSGVTDSVTEIAPGVYKFDIVVNGSIATFQASKAIGATLVKSNLFSVSLTPLSKFNPVVSVDVYNYDPIPYFGDADNYTWDLLPTKIGYSFILKTGVWDVFDPNKYEIQYTRAQVTGPVFHIDYGDPHYNNSFNIPTISETVESSLDGYPDDVYHNNRYLVTGTGKIEVKITQKTWERVDPSAYFDEFNACCLSDSMVFTIGEDKCCDVKVENPEIKVGTNGDIKIDVSGEACGCDVVVRVSPSVPAEDFFTLADGTTVGELWYNLTGAAHNYTTEECYIYPWPYSDYHIDVGFQVTNGGATFVGGVVKWPNVTANYCGWLKVEVFTRETTSSCAGSCSTYKFCAVLPYAIHATNDIVTITADKDTLVAGLPEVVTFKGLELNSGSTMWVYYSDSIPWNRWIYSYPTDNGYGFINNGDGTATVNFLPPPSFYGVAYTDDDFGGAALTVEFRTPLTDGTGCVLRQIAKLHVEPPKAEASITTGCGEKIPFDGILTEGFAETFCIESLKDPRNDTSIIDKVVDLDFDYYYDTYSGNCYIPGAWADYSSCAGCGVLCQTVLGLRNPNSNDDPNIYPYITMNGVYVYLTELKMVVTPPTIKVDPDKDIPFTTLGQPETMLTLSAIDAHGKPMCGKTFSIYDINTMTSAVTLVGYHEVGPASLPCVHEPVAIPNTGSEVQPMQQEDGYGLYIAAYTSANQYHTGTTGSDGNVVYPFRPPFAGRFAVVIVPDAGTTIGAPKLPLMAFLKSMQLMFETKYVPPVKDTEAPAIEVASPADGSEVKTPIVTITGKVTDNVGVVSLWIGAMKVDFAPDGTFSAKVELAEGDNAIRVFAFDAAGNKTEKVVNVKYAKPVEPKKIVVVVQIGSDIMTVNGKVVQLDAAPEIKDGRTFLPLRAIAEALGAQVEWIEETKGITVTLGDHTVGLQIGNPTAVVDGNVIDIVAPYIKNGRTMVPLRVIAEGLGAEVTWDPVLRTVTITLVVE